MKRAQRSDHLESLCPAVQRVVDCVFRKRKERKGGERKREIRSEDVVLLLPAEMQQQRGGCEMSEQG